MRWFMIPAVATVALVLADTAPAKAQVIVGGNPTLLTPNSVPFAPLAGSLLPGASGSLFPGASGVIPFANGGPVELALNRALWNMAGQGYGPLAGYYGPLAGTRYFGGPYPANAIPWNVYPPLTVPGNPGTWVQPWPGNNGLHKGWYKGGGKGGGKPGKGGKGR